MVGKTLYAYDYKVGYEKLYSMDLPDEVSMMKFDVKSGYGDYNDLYIALITVRREERYKNMCWEPIKISLS